ncbi:MAG: NAD(P)H-dependent oxidoreductase subunit E [Bdellovibrionaceae bacterium]|nr:NAD(P)H-dependent oxidoreductase subunit E [Pseudobdellovibrionaceae bacterium]
MFKLSSDGEAFVQSELKRYETKESAIIPSLYRVQKENGGWVSPDCIQYLSTLMDIPASRINEVFQFYTMFNKEPVGKFHVQVCCNVACCMAGSREMIDKLCEDYGVEEGEVTSDKRFTFTRVECLGACDKAPMMQVNETYHEGLTMDSAKKILRELK